MIFNIHAGHNPAGKIACGASSILNESRENRIVKNEVIRLLRLLGHTVYDCTVDNGTSRNDVLRKIVAKCNANDVDLDVSIHLNSGAKDIKGNGQTTGAEVFYYDQKSTRAKTAAINICAAMERLGFKNRGAKANPGLYVLRNTKAQAILVECCFVDDRDDALLWDPDSVAEAIVFGLTGQRYVEPEVADQGEGEGEDSATGDGTAIYRVQVGAYVNRNNAEHMLELLKENGFTAFITKA